MLHSLPSAGLGAGMPVDPWYVTGMDPWKSSPVDRCHLRRGSGRHHDAPQGREEGSAWEDNHRVAMWATSWRWRRPAESYREVKDLSLIHI
eukprot:1128140-Prorocentrum_lima.AAC.1